MGPTGAGYGGDGKGQTLKSLRSSRGGDVHLDGHPMDLVDDRGMNSHELRPGVEIIIDFHQVLAAPGLYL